MWEFDPDSSSIILYVISFSFSFRFSISRSSVTFSFFKDSKVQVLPASGIVKMEWYQNRYCSCNLAVTLHRGLRVHRFPGVHRVK